MRWLVRTWQELGRDELYAIGMKSQHSGRERVFVGFVESVGGSNRCLGSELRQRYFLHPIQDEPGKRHVFSGEAFNEVRRLA